MKNKHIFIPLFIFLGAGVVSLTASIVDFTAVNKQLSYSSEMIQFNYNGASDGLDPNGNSFDAVNFMTDDVVSKALAASNLTGEKYEIERVKQYIAIENVVPKRIINEINSYTSIITGKSTATIRSTDYHPVRYRFVVYQDLNNSLSQSALNTFVNNLVQEYRAKFTATYQKTFNKDAHGNLLDLDSYDYKYQAEILTNKITTVGNYALELYNKHNEFAVNNKSFNDIASKANQLADTVKSVNEIITYRAISKDPTRLKDYYDHQLQELGYSKNKYDADLANINNQITNYHKDDKTYVGSGETVIEVSSNSGETYDALLARKIEIENALADINTKITDFTDLKARVDAVTQADRNNVKSRITAIKTNYEAIETEFTALLAEYNAKYIGSKAVAYSKTTYHSSSLISSTFIIHTVKVAAPIMLSVMLGIAIYYLVREVRKPHRKAEEEKKA